MRKATKKIFSLLLCLSMITAIFPFAGIGSASAADKFTLELEVYKCADVTNPQSTDISAENKLNSGEYIAEGQGILVGLKYSNLSKLTTYGLDALVAEIVYDYEYFEPQYTTIGGSAVAGTKSLVAAKRKALLKLTPFYETINENEYYSISNTYDLDYTDYANTGETNTTKRIIHYSLAPDPTSINTDSVIKDENATLMYFSFVAKKNTTASAAKFELYKESTQNVLGYYISDKYQTVGGVSNDPPVSKTNYNDMLAVGMAEWTPFEIGIGDAPVVLPKATDWTEASKAAITAATSGIKASDELTQAQLLAKLNDLTNLKVKDANENEYDVTAVWTQDADEVYSEKGGTYTYTAAVTSSNSDVDISDFAPTATIEVAPVNMEFEANKFDNKTILQGTAVTDHASLGLPTGGTATAGSATFPYTVTWSPAVNLDTNDVNASQEFTATITWTDETNIPAYVTLPDTSNIKTTVSIDALPVATDLTDASKTAITTASAAIKASSDDNTEAGLLAKLPTALQVTDGTNNYDVTAAWTKTAGDYNVKGGTYTYTAALSTTAAVNISGIIAPTASITVTPVTAAYEINAFADKTIALNTSNASHSDLGLTTSGNAAADNVNYPYTVTWTEAANTLDTATEGANQTFNGTVSFTNAPEWLTLPNTAVQTKLTVATLPVATDLTDASKTAITTAEADVKASANLDADALLAKLPTALKVTDGTNEYNVTAAWTTTDTFNVKGGTYTYTAALTPTDAVNTTNLAAPTAAITVTPVTISVDKTTDFAAKQIEKDTSNATHEALGLTMSGTAKADSTDIPYTVTWTSPASTEFDTSTAEESKTFTGTISFTNAPEWATVPTDLTVTQTLTVKPDAPKPAATDLTQTSKDAINAAGTENISASSDKNTADGLAGILPTELQVTDGTNEYDVTAAWTTTDTFNAKGGTYTYTAELTAKNGDVDLINIAAPTAQITVEPVTVSFDQKVFDALTVAKKTDNSTFETLGLATTGKATLTPSVEGTEVGYTIAWTPESTSLDTSKSGASRVFEGTITFNPSDVKDWMTLPTGDDLKGSKTVKVKSSSSGGGGSAVTITLDKTSLNGEAGSSEKITATVKGSTSAPKWTSSDEKVATVDADGNVTFVGEGKATIKVNVSGTVKSIPVTVTAAAEPTPTPVPTAKPTDKPVIDVNYTKPYASGYEDDSFRPENNITRAELAAMIARLSNGEDIEDGAYNASFPDVSADAWYNKYIGYLEGLDVLSGYEDGTFRPDDTITRGEISAVIARAQKYDLISVDEMFTDVTADDWAKDYITTLASKDIVSGYEDGSFGTYSPLTRAEAVAIINRVLAPSAPVVTFTPNDIADHWAEADIILAVNERQADETAQ